MSILDGLSPTAAYSVSRALLSSYAGSLYNLTSSRVDTLFDQSGNVLNMTQGTGVTRPVIDTSTPIAALNFNGSNQLTNAHGPSSFITNTTGYMIASVRNTSFLTDNPGQPYANAQIIEDSGQNCGMTFSNNSGSPLFYAINNGAVSAAVIAGTSYIIEWRHEGGNLFQRLNGTNETSVVDGNTNMTGTSMRIGGQSFNGLIFEVATFSVVPSLSDRNAIASDFLTHLTKGQMSVTYNVGMNLILDLP